MKTFSEEEAEKLILNAKDKGGWGAKIKMQINEKRQNEKVQTSNFDQKGEKVEPKVTERAGRVEKEDPLITKMFKYIEIDVDENIEQGLYHTKVAYSKEVLDVDTLQTKRLQEKMNHIKIVGLNERKFLMRT